MNTPTIETRVEAAQILKQSSWTYEYCHGETVRESTMATHISQIEDGLRETSLEDLFEIITILLYTSPPDEPIDNAEALAKYVAHDIAIGFVEDFYFETVTFKFH